MVSRVCVIPLLAALAEANLFLSKSMRHLPTSQLVVVHSKLAKHAHAGLGQANGGAGADVPWDDVLDADEFDVEAELMKASGSKKTTSEFSAKKVAKKEHDQIRVNFEDDLKLALRDKDWVAAGEIQAKLDKHNGKKRKLRDIGKHGGEKRVCKNAEKAKEEMEALKRKQQEENGEDEVEEEDPAEVKKREDKWKKDQEECEKKVVILSKNLMKDNFTSCPTELILKGSQAAKTYNASNIFGVYTEFVENEADRALHSGRKMFVNEKTGLNLFYSKKYDAWRIGTDPNSAAKTKVISPREEKTWCPTSATEWKVYNGFGFAETDITVTKNDAKAEAEAAKAEAEKLKAAKAKADAAKAEAKKAKAQKAMAAKAKAEAAKAEAKQAKDEEAMAEKKKAEAAKAEAKQVKDEEAMAEKKKADSAAKDVKRTVTTKEEKTIIPGAISMKADKKPAKASVAIAAALAASYGMDAKVREAQNRADKIKDVPGAKVKYMPKVEEAREEEGTKTKVVEARMKEEEEGPKTQVVEAPTKEEEEAPKAAVLAARINLKSSKENQKKAHEWAKNRMSDILKRSGVPDYRSLYASPKGAKAVVAAAPPVVYASTRITKAAAVPKPVEAVAAKPIAAKATPVVAKVLPVATQPAAAARVAQAVVAKPQAVAAVATAAAAKPAPVVAQPVAAPGPTPEDDLRSAMQDMMKMAMKSMPKAQKPVTQLFQESAGSDANDAETNAQVEAEFNNAIETI